MSDVYGKTKHDGKSRNLDKLSYFIEDCKKGYIIYENGSLYRTVRRYGIRGTKGEVGIKKLESPEKMSSLNKGNKYYRIGRKVGDKRYTVYEHTVIYAIFHGVKELTDDVHIDHINGDRFDNRIENLELVSSEENNRRLIELDLLKPRYGEDNGASVLTESDVLKIRDLYSRKEYNQYELSDMFEVSQGQISAIVNRKRWAHI